MATSFNIFNIFASFAFMLSRHTVVEECGPQSGQSAKLFLQSLELGLPKPLARKRVWPSPPLWFLGKGTLVCGRGGGGVPIPTRGHIRWNSMNICTVWYSPYIMRWTRRLWAIWPAWSSRPAGATFSYSTPCRGYHHIFLQKKLKETLSRDGYFFKGLSF